MLLDTFSGALDLAVRVNAQPLPRDAMRPDVRIDDEVHRLPELERLFPFRVGEPSVNPGYLSPRRDESWIDDTSRQSNTPSIESREVRYPWHPWHGRTVWIYQSLKKQGEGILRCRMEQDPSVSLQELPEWMFDRRLVRFK